VPFRFEKCRVILPRILLIGLGFALISAGVTLFAADHSEGSAFPPPLAGYTNEPGAPLIEVLESRVRAEPFNLVATLIFALAITHTFLAPFFLRLSHKMAADHARKAASNPEEHPDGDVSFVAEILHFFGEVEVVFGIWVIPLALAIALDKGYSVARQYVAQLNFTEPIFVVVIMTMAASRPVLRLAEKTMAVFAALGRGSPAAWWLSILTLGPLLGSFITEPAAMTISALLLGKKIYSLDPRPAFAYGTLGLLFVNVSVGGTLTHFAAPPVLMVAGRWDWDFVYMLTHFGWKAALGICVANAIYFLTFRRDFGAMRLATVAAKTPGEDAGRRPVPAWITIVHLLFLAWTVFNNHYPVLCIGGFMFYIAFTVATSPHQQELALRPALLVGFFLAGLVIHGGLQGWWIQPVLTSLREVPLFTGATILTAFNDNAAITYLASLVPGFSPELKYAVVAGAVVGGGLTVIANAPNPAGQSILSKYFPDGVSPLNLFLGALAPTLVMAASFLLFR
jgi:hypothetical protein